MSESLPVRCASAALLAAHLVVALAGLAEEPVPEPNLEALEPRVRERMQTARQALLIAIENPDLDQAEKAELYGETGKVFHAHHAFEVAAACYRNASQLDPSDPQWPYLIGLIHQDSGRFAEARAEYEKVLATDPQHAFASFRVAQVFLDLNELDAAEPILEQALEVPALTASAHESLGKIASARGEHQAAIEHYSAALELEPEATRLHTPLGLAYRSARQIDKAREHLGQRGEGKIRIDDPVLLEIGAMTVSSEMFISAATQAIKTGRFEDAEQAYRGAIAVNPDNPRPHVNLAELLARRSALDEAEASAREALRLDPESFFVNFNLGHIFELRGEPATAAEFFARALDKDPSSVKANYRYAGVLMKTGRYQQAAELYGIAAELAPAFSHARYLQTLAYVALRDYDDALATAEEAVEITPDSVDLKSALARLLATTSTDRADADRSFALAKELFDLEPSAENVETVAMALAAVGRFEEAVAAQLSVIEAARGAGESATLTHLEHNLERYRSGLASDRPWQLGVSADDDASTDGSG